MLQTSLQRPPPAAPPDSSKHPHRSRRVSIAPNHSQALEAAGSVRPGRGVADKGAKSRAKPALG